MPKLENWSIIDSNPNPYHPPELAVQRLSGEVYGHPDYEDGDRIITSRILGQEGGMVKTKSRNYELGTIDPQYEASFPNARNRFFSTLPVFDDFPEQKAD